MRGICTSKNNVSTRCYHGPHFSVVEIQIHADVFSEVLLEADEDDKEVIEGCIVKFVFLVYSFSDDGWDDGGESHFRIIWNQVIFNSRLPAACTKYLFMGT